MTTSKGNTKQEKEIPGREVERCTLRFSRQCGAQWSLMQKATVDWRPEAGAGRTPWGSWVAPEGH